MANKILRYSFTQSRLVRIKDLSIWSIASDGNGNSHTLLVREMNHSGKQYTLPAIPFLNLNLLHIYSIHNSICFQGPKFRNISNIL